MVDILEGLVLRGPQQGLAQLFPRFPWPRPHLQRLWKGRSSQRPLRKPPKNLESLDFHTFSPRFATLFMDPRRFAGGGAKEVYTAAPGGRLR